MILFGYLGIRFNEGVMIVKPNMKNLKYLCIKNLKVGGINIEIRVENGITFINGRKTDTLEFE